MVLVRSVPIAGFPAKDRTISPVSPPALFVVFVARPCEQPYRSRSVVSRRLFDVEEIARQPAFGHRGLVRLGRPGEPGRIRCTLNAVTSPALRSPAGASRSGGIERFEVSVVPPAPVSVSRTCRPRSS